MEEIWKMIPGYETPYMASNIGRIRSLERIDQKQRFGVPYFLTRKEAIKKLWTDKHGYLVTRLQHPNKKNSNMFVHRLVALAFIPNPENKPFINHKDGDPKNNTVENLEWCTQKENIAHAWATGLSFRKKGSQNGLAKPVIAIDPAGKIIKFGSLIEASEKLGVARSDISRVINNKRNMNHAGGYKFQRAN